MEEDVEASGGSDDEADIFDDVVVLVARSSALFLPFLFTTVVDVRFIAAASSAALVFAVAPFALLVVTVEALLMASIRRVAPAAAVLGLRRGGRALPNS